MAVDTPSPGADPPPSTAAPPGIPEATRRQRSDDRKALGRLLIAVVVVILVVVLLTVLPLGSANRTKSTSWGFAMPLGGGGGTESISANFPQLCTQSRADHNLSADQTLSFHWSTDSGSTVSSLELASTATFPWTVFYNVTDRSSDAASWSGASELDLACSSGVVLLAGMSTALSINVDLTLTCTYSVAAPIL